MKLIGEKSVRSKKENLEMVTFKNKLKSRGLEKPSPKLPVGLKTKSKGIRAPSAVWARGGNR